MNAFELAASLTLDTSQYEKGLDTASGDANKFEKALKTAGKVGAAAFTAVATASAAVGTAVVKATQETAAYGDNVDKMSQKVGMSAEAYQQWDYVLKISGTEMASMTTGLKTLTNKLDEAKNGSASATAMFESLGLSMEDLSNMSREDVFSAVITGFQQMEDSTERAALANDLFGKSGQELTPLFNTSIEETQALKDKVYELGGVMSEDAVKASAAYTDSLTNLQTSFSGLKRGLVSDFMGGLTKVMNGLSEIFSGNSDSGIKKVADGVEEVVNMISNKMPEFIDLGLRILQSLVTALINNLPKLLESGGRLIGELVAGLIRAIPQIIASIPQIIKAIIDGLVAAWPEIRQAGADLVHMIGDGIGSLASQAWNWGADLIRNFIDGITAWAQNLWNTVKNIAQGVANFLGFSEPKDGPLSNFHTYAPDMMKLFAKGIKDNEDMLYDTVADAFDFGNVTINSAQSINGSGEQGQIVIPITAMLDGKVIYESVKTYQRNELRAYG